MTKSPDTFLLYMQARTLEELWTELEVFAKSHNRPWIAREDFNETIYLHERNGNNSGMRRRCNNFNVWIENKCLMDMDYTGPSFIWSRCKSPRTKQWAKLDRGLCNTQWRIMFEEGSLRHLIQNQSDHCHIVVSTNGFAPIPNVLRHFRFQTAWMCHDKFSEFVSKHWDNDQPLLPFDHTFTRME